MKKENMVVHFVVILYSLLFIGCAKELEISIVNYSPEESITKVKIWQVADIKTYQSWDDIQKIEKSVELLGTTPIIEENVNILSKNKEEFKFTQLKSDKVYILTINNKEVWFIIDPDGKRNLSVFYQGSGFYITNKSSESITQITVWQFPKVFTSEWGIEEVIKLLESTPVIDQVTNIPVDERKYFELNSSNVYVIMVDKNINSQNEVKIIEEGGKLQNLVWNGQTIN
jgi:hypothetical protein